MLWGKAPPSFCLRTQQEGKQSQVGVKGTDLKPELGTSTPKKGLQLKEFADNLIKGLKPNVPLEDKVLDREAIKASKDRDIAIEKFYTEKARALAIENESKAPKLNINNFRSVHSLLFGLACHHRTRMCTPSDFLTRDMKHHCLSCLHLNPLLRILEC